MPLHPLALDAVQEITAHVPPEKVGEWFNLFFSEVSALDAVARRKKRRAEAQDVIDSLDLPLKVGEISLYRLSVGGVEWLENYPQKWWGRDALKPDMRLVELATVYAMANRGKAPYESLTAPKAAKRAIIEWAKNTMIAEDLLITAASYLIPENDPVSREIMGVQESSESSIDIQAIAAKVAEISGCSVVSAIWEMSADNFWNIYCDWIDAREAELNENLKAAKKALSVETWVVMQKIALIKARRVLLKKTLEWLKEQQAAKPAERSGNR